MQTQALTTFAVLGAVLCAAAVIDVRTGRIPNVLVYPAMLLGLLMAMGFGATRGGWNGLWDGATASLTAFMAAALPFAFCFMIGAVGGGDVKLMAAVGAISAKWECVLGTALYGFIIGLFMAIFVMVQRGLVKQTMQRLWIAVVTVRAGVKHDMPTDSPRLPYALAFAIGGLIAGAEHLLQLRMPWSEYFG